MKNHKKKFQATTLRNILVATLVIVILGSATGFYFGLQIIKSYALEVTHAVTDSKASGTTVQDLSQLKQQLADGDTLVAKANSIFSTPTTYQTQALKDISKYAKESGITITSIDSGQAAAPSPGAPSGPVGPSGPGQQGPPSPSGMPVSDYSEIITIQSTVSYAKFIQFLSAIEGNLPKMQITGISIGRPAIASGDLITTEKITVTVSTR